MKKILYVLLMFCVCEGSIFAAQAADDALTPTPPQQQGLDSPEGVQASDGIAGRPSSRVQQNDEVPAPSLFFRTLVGVQPVVDVAQDASQQQIQAAPLDVPAAAKVGVQPAVDVAQDPLQQQIQAARPAAANESNDRGVDPLEASIGKAIPGASGQLVDLDKKENSEPKPIDSNDKAKRDELIADLKRAGIWATSAAVAYVGLTALEENVNPVVALSALLGAKLFTKKEWVPVGETTEAVLDGLLIGGVVVAVTNPDKIRVPSLPTVLGGMGSLTNGFGQRLQSVSSSQPPSTNYLSQPYKK